MADTCGCIFGFQNKTIVFRQDFLDNSGIETNKMFASWSTVLKINSRKDIEISDPYVLKKNEVK